MATVVTNTNSGAVPQPAFSLVDLGRVAEPVRELPENWYGSAPYVLIAESPPDLAQAMAATGQRTFVLASVVAAADGGCVPTWTGGRPLTSDTVAHLVDSVRMAGGDVAVSFGGADGTTLGETCAGPQATADAYQQVVDRYRLKAVDLRLDASGHHGDSALANELGGAALLQRRNPGLYVSVTTAGTTAGTGWFGQRVLDHAKSIGFAPDNYTIAAFDNGFTGTAAQIAALEGFHSQLMHTLGWDSGTAYAREGFLGLSGRSDAAEVFTPSDFQTVLDYALAHKMGRYTFWAVNRDRACDPGRGHAPCSAVPQETWEFTGRTAHYGTVTTPSLPARPASAEPSATVAPPPAAVVAPPATGPARNPSSRRPPKPIRIVPPPPTGPPSVTLPPLPPIGPLPPIAAHAPELPPVAPAAPPPVVPGRCVDWRTMVTSWGFRTPWWDEPVDAPLRVCWCWPETWSPWRSPALMGPS